MKGEGHGEGEEPEIGGEDYSYLEREKGISNFWSKALTENPDFMALANEEKDEFAMQNISGVSIDQAVEPEKGIARSRTIALKFRLNEFFTNPELKMTVFFKDIEMYQIDRVESTTIDWKEGKDMSKELQ